MNWLLAFVPIAIALHFFAPQQPLLVFGAACAAMIPLAGWLGRATEQVAARSSESVGGLLNATFGNAAELIIALVALRGGHTEIVEASLTGSILGNLLLVMGCSMLAGGIRFKTQKFNERNARVQSTMLFLAATALIVPAAFHHLAGPHAQDRALSFDISLVLLAVYALSLLFTLRTHPHLLAPCDPEIPAEHQAWPLRKGLAVLSGATVMIAWVSEILVGAVEPAAHTLGMSNLFVGVVVVGIIGNAAEHSTAITVALKNRMDLSLNIAVGSTIQIALFVAPVLVLASYMIAPAPMNLVFTPMEVIAIVLAVLVSGQIAGDGESNWLEGAQLLAVYTIIAIAFYFLPATH